MASGYDRTYHSDPYERTYSNIPKGYERTYNFDPYKRTYGRDPYERTYSNDGHYPSQHDKYPPMKPHYPKYPSPHKTPKPSVWKSEKTPKPSAWKKEKTPKPTWHKDEKTPKPTVWKSDHDKTPKHYSMNEEEQENENGELQNSGICMLDLYQQCTRAFVLGKPGCYCKSGCCEVELGTPRCVPKKREWFGIHVCPSVCVGTPGGAR